MLSEQCFIRMLGRKQEEIFPAVVRQEEAVEPYHAKAGLKFFVVVKPKEGLAGTSPSLLLV